MEGPLTFHVRQTHTNYCAIMMIIISPVSYIARQTARIVRASFNYTSTAQPGLIELKYINL